MSGWKQAGWRKSSHSDHQGGNCIELRRLGSSIAVRDSKNPDDPRLVFGRTAFRAIARQIRSQ